VPFAAAAVWSSGHVQRVLWGSLAVVAAVFGSYRVWRKERIDASTRLESLRAEKDSEINRLCDRVTEITSKPDFEMKVSAEGTPPSQVLKIVANRLVTVSRVDYMLSSGASIAGEDVSVQGEKVELPINDSLVLKLWIRHAMTVTTSTILALQRSQSQFLRTGSLASIFSRCRWKVCGREAPVTGRSLGRRHSMASDESQVRVLPRSPQAHVAIAFFLCSR
jgi:hypothetical protein